MKYFDSDEEEVKSESEQSFKPVESDMETGIVETNTVPAKWVCLFVEEWKLGAERDVAPW